MPTPSASRRLGLTDLIALIGVSALALVGARWAFRVSQLQRPTTGAVSSWVDFNRTLAILIVANITASLTLFQLVARFRRPRPRFRLVARQPGTAASIAAGLVLAIHAAQFGVAWLKPARGIVRQSNVSFRIEGFNVTEFVFISTSYDTIGFYLHPFALALIQPCGFAVTGAWLTLALSGRWRAEASWIDRLGRALGIVWIALTAIATIGVF
jgi:hypothetical protein